MSLDWQQLRERKCPRCKGDLVAKSLLESLWMCVCGFEITGEQYEGIISKWMYRPSKRKVAIVEEPTQDELDLGEEDYLQD